ncbi:hypothetical protein P6F26_16900 [Roseibacterium sp. SDUM158017]|uniref:hypothetical protein n=1 Tax=Roseicyclus salinarum TaxID=3036773 RepID=UPI002415173D|nr:hypothetical protein [Roseibacterium sp. SDUM158017]MDG4650129.1 hypothetical protein [Roseibacterium sp. SDUM158017]
MTKNLLQSTALNGQIVTLSATQGGLTRSQTVPTWNQTPPPDPGGGDGAVTISVSRYPTGSVLPGEAIMFFVTGVTGWAGDDHEDLDFEWNFGDSGAEFTVATGLPGGPSSNVEFGRVVSHAYTTAGVKDVSVTVSAHGQVVKTINLSAFTVQNPDDIDWQNDLYVSFAGDFTGVPAEDIPNGIRRVSDVATLTGTNWQGPTRIRFRRGETYIWGASSCSTTGRAYVSNFGAGNRPVVRSAPAATLGTNQLDFFDPGTAANSHIAIYGVDFDGTYRAPSATYDDGGYCVVFGTNPNQAAANATQYRSLFQVSTTGMKETYSSDGAYRNIRPDVLVYFCGADLDIKDWYNYGITAMGGWTRLAITGCNLKQNRDIILRGDHILGDLTDTPSHGPMRISIMDYFGVTNCNLWSASGWAASGIAFQAIQPCIRALPPYSTTDGSKPFTRSVINIQRNHGIANDFLVVGRNRDVKGEVGITFPRSACVVDRNFHQGTRQVRPNLIGSSTSGIYARNNVIYLPNVYAQGGGVKYEIFGVGMPDDGTLNWAYEPGFFEDPYIAEFNTIISDLDVNHPGTAKPLELIGQTSSWRGPPIRHENNMVYAPNHVSVTINDVVVTPPDDTPFDRTQNFRPATGSAAIDAVSSGKIPVRDFAGNLRGATTNRGAHDAESVSAGTVAAPVKATAPTIAPTTNFPGEYYTSAGAEWTNMPGADAYMVEWEWRRNGTRVPWHGSTYWSRDGRITLIIDPDSGTPAYDNVRGQKNSLDNTAAFRRRIDRIGGHASYSENLIHGLSGTVYAWMIWENLGGVEEGPVGVAGNVAGTATINSHDGVWTLESFGDGTFQIRRAPRWAGQDLTLVMIGTNRSGARVASDPSNAITLP